MNKIIYPSRTDTEYEFPEALYKQAQDGDDKVLNYLFSKHENLIRFFMKKLENMFIDKIDPNEYLSTAYLSLSKAILTYDSTKGKFSNYYGEVIKNSFRVLNIYNTRQCRGVQDQPTSLQTIILDNDDNKEKTLENVIATEDDELAKINAEDKAQDMINKIKGLLTPLEYETLCYLYNGKKLTDIPELTNKSRQHIYKYYTEMKAEFNGLRDVYSYYIQNNKNLEDTAKHFKTDTKSVSEILSTYAYIFNGEPYTSNVSRNALIKSKKININCQKELIYNYAKTYYSSTPFSLIDISKKLNMNAITVKGLIRLLIKDGKITLSQNNLLSVSGEHAELV